MSLSRVANGQVVALTSANVLPAGFVPVSGDSRKGNWVCPVTTCPAANGWKSNGTGWTSKRALVIHLKTAFTKANGAPTGHGNQILEDNGARGFNIFGAIAGAQQVAAVVQQLPAVVQPIVPAIAPPIAQPSAVLPPPQLAPPPVAPPTVITQDMVDDSIAAAIEPIKGILTRLDALEKAASDKQK